MKTCSSVCPCEKYSMEFLLGLANAYRKCIFQAKGKRSWRSFCDCVQEVCSLQQLEIPDTREDSTRSQVAWDQAQNITNKNLQKKYGKEETQDMTAPLTVSLPLKQRFCLLSIKDLYEHFSTLRNVHKLSQPIRADLRKTFCGLL